MKNAIVMFTGETIVNVSIDIDLLVKTKLAMMNTEVVDEIISEDEVPDYIRARAEDPAFEYGEEHIYEDLGFNSYNDYMTQMNSISIEDAEKLADLAKNCTNHVSLEDLEAMFNDDEEDEA